MSGLNVALNILTKTKMVVFRLLMFHAGIVMMGATATCVKFLAKKGSSIIRGEGKSVDIDVAGLVFGAASSLAAVACMREAFLYR